MKLNNALVKGSLILIITFGVYNFLNFIFQFSMARLLSVADYGILATLFSILYLLTIFNESIQTIITKYTSQESEKGKLKSILNKSFKKAFLLSSLLFGGYLILSILFSFILDIPYYLLALNGTIIFSSFLLPISRGTMQGKKRFGSLGINMISESVFKLILGIVFVFLGWRVFGAVLGTVLGVGISFFISFIPIKDIVKSKAVKSKTSGIYNYAKPTFFITFVIIAFYSIDIIIARSLFSDELAGSYAIASILSKSIFWGTEPISRVMFPLSSENSSKKGSKNIFNSAFLILISLIAIALILFYLFPGLIIKIFSGKDLTESIRILFILGVGTSVISIANLVLLYKLSLNKVRGYQLLGIFVLIEIALLIYFSNDLVQFSMAFVTSAFAFLWGITFILKETT